MIDVSRQEGDKDEEFFYRAQLAMANKNFPALRANYQKISSKHPSKPYLKKIIDQIDNVELLYKSYAMAESLIKTLISFLENRGDGDRFEIDELKALLVAWKFRLESGKFDTTTAILNDIQQSKNINAKKALGFLRNIASRKIKANSRIGIYT